MVMVQKTVKKMMIRVWLFHC